MNRMDLASPVKGFTWLNAPAAAFFGSHGLRITTCKNTDFWQRTHYGFQRDDGHFYYTTSGEDFRFIAKFRFAGKVQYEQCGLMVRVDAGNWIKCSTEYENATLSRLGSVVTHHGYSDWATQDIASDTDQVYYGIQRNGADFLLEYSWDGLRYAQMRIAHLHRAEGNVMLGIYACSPKSDAFECVVEEMAMGPSTWAKP